MSLSKFLDPKNDIAFRKIFGSEKHKDILIHFINDILGFTGDNAIQQVTFLPTVQDPDIASKKQSIVDVLCKDAKGVQIIVEMQVAPTKGFEKRAQFYASKAYCGQLNKGQEEDGLYHNLKEVIFIAIADYVMFPEKKRYKSDHVLLDKEDHSHDLKDFSFTFIELPKFKKKKIEQLETIIERWCYFFKYASETSEQDLEQLAASDLVIKDAYEALNQFNWTEAELLAYDQEIKRIRDNRAALEYQIDKAKAEGREEGREEGIEQVAKNLLKQGLSIDAIAKATGLSPAKIRQLQ